MKNIFECIALIYKCIDKREGSQAHHFNCRIYDSVVGFPFVFRQAEENLPVWKEGVEMLQVFPIPLLLF